MIRVWDRVVRLVHWSVVLLVFANFLNESGSDWHRYGGYLAGGLVIMRIVWGFISSGYARFTRWWPGLRAISNYARAVAAGKAPRYIGINPLGASMAVLIWALLGLLALTGWMMSLDALWGEEWLEQMHAAIAYGLLVCVAIHIVAVVVMSLRHRENLPLAMLTGKKRLLKGDTTNQLR
jgi:cytochrome b